MVGRRRRDRSSDGERLGSATLHGPERWRACVRILCIPWLPKKTVNMRLSTLTLYSSIEDYSYFTLRRAATTTHPATSLFGISCTRQLDASQLIDRPADVTRSTVQKAVVVISDRPQCFGAIKAQLGVVTAAWFAQKDFTDIEILQRFHESLPQLLRNQEGQAGQDFGMPSRIRHFETRLTIQACHSANSYTNSNGRRWSCSNALYSNPRCLT
jgi:hypothetical protein